MVGDRKLGKDLFLDYIWNLGVSGSYNKTIRQFYKQDDIIYWFENGYLAKYKFVWWLGGCVPPTFRNSACVETRQGRPRL